MLGDIAFTARVLVCSNTALAKSLNDTEQHPEACLMDTLEHLDPPIVVEPEHAPSGCVILLHGLGADGHDFQPIVSELSSALQDQIRFIFPHAPRISVTINGGMVMRAWYDITNLDGEDFDRRADEGGVRSSSSILSTLVDNQVASGIAPNRIVAAGFSQGGAIALHTALRYPHQLAGILAISTYLPLQSALVDERLTANDDTPIFLGHGSQDSMIPLSHCERTRLVLRNLGYPVETHTYPMAHSVCPEEIRDIDDWLCRVLVDPFNP